jgi:hypothetical protein
MVINFNPSDPFHLTDDEIHELAIFTGTYSEDVDEETKQRWMKAYRDSEDETNKMIAQYGSVEKWYESGEGRSL